MARTNEQSGHFPPDSRAFGLTLALVAVLLLTISPLALLALGYNYDDTGGNAFEKVHPGTLLAFALLGACGLMQRNPLTSLLNALLAWPGTAMFVLMIGLLILHCIRVLEVPFTGFIDTFLAPVAVFFLFKDMRDTRAGRFVWLFHVLILSNAVVGLAEFATGTRLTPLVASGLVIEDDWRSTALLGHPLANAILTGAYILAMALGAARQLPRPVAALAFILSAAGMVVFGGRASTLLLIGILACLGVWRGFAILQGAHFQKRAILAALITLPVLALCLGVLEEAGFFDLFIERFFDDNGSADTRVEMFELFRHMPFDELLLAPDPGQLATYKRLYGLDFGIESFWISFVLSYGLIPGLVFFVTLFLFCRDVVRAAAPGAIWVLAFFFIVASTSVSLSAKTPVFAVLILLIMVLLRVREPKPVNRTHTQSAGRMAHARAYSP